MKLVWVALQPLCDGIASRYRHPVMVRAFSTNSPYGNSNIDGRNSGSFESSEDFEKRIFGGNPEDDTNPLFRTLSTIEKIRKSGMSYEFNGQNVPQDFDRSDEIFTTSTEDGMGERLKKSAMDFEVDHNEIEQDDYNFRPDMNFQPGMTYEPKDLDLRKPGVWKPSKRREFEVTTEEVLIKADFRNVRFLANFITEAGIIIKRSQTKISAKAQRKVAREIKTARAFGLMPFTSMGSKAFVFGKTMQDLDEDYEYDRDARLADADSIQDPLE